MCDAYDKLDAIPDDFGYEMPAAFATPKMVPDSAPPEIPDDQFGFLTVKFRTSVESFPDMFLGEITFPMVTGEAVKNIEFLFEFKPISQEQAAGELIRMVEKKLVKALFGE